MPSMPPRVLYRLFPLAGRTSAWVKQRFPAVGRMVLSLLVCGILFGIDLRQTLGYQIASLSFALLLTSILLSVRWRPRLRVERILPDLVTAQVPMSYYLKVTNLGTRDERDLVVQDQLVTPPMSYDAFQRRRRQRSTRRTNWFDRAVGYPRWVEMRRRDRGAEIRLVAIPTIAAGASVQVKIDSTVVRRGWIQYQHTQILRPDPLGLFRARRNLPTKEALLALPQRYAVPHIHMQSQRHYQKGGVSLALAVGDSQEFASLRDYRPGDARRHIHWRSLAKSGRLMVKQYQDEYFDRHALVIDTHVEANEEELFESIISVAASVAGGERPRDSILDVIFVGAQMVQLSAGRGLGDAASTLTYLAEAVASVDADFAATTNVLRERAGELASVIFVLASVDDERQQLLDELLVRGISCLCLLVGVGDEESDGLERLGTHRVFGIRSGHLSADLARIDLTP